MLKLRDLFVKIGFQSNGKPLQQIHSGLERIKKSVKHLTYLFIGSSGLAAGMGYFLKQAGFYEQVTVSLETMLGSTEKAANMLNDLKEFTMETPFELKDLLSNTKMLLGMGIASDDIIDTLTNLGNVAAGLSVPIERLALNYGQVLAQSKLTLRETRDFAFAGVPILQVLSTQLKKPISEIQKLIQAGKISFEQTRDAFKYMASDGGRFANLMLKQSKTLFGMLSITKDYLFMIAMELGQELLPGAKKTLGAFIDWLRVNKEFIKLNVGKQFKIIGHHMYTMFIIAKHIIHALWDMINNFGGLDKVLKTLAISFTIFTAGNVLTGIGLITNGIWKLTTAYAALGTTAKLSTLKMLAYPAAIGLALVAIGFIFEDILSYLKGKDSFTGWFDDWMNKKFPELKKGFELFFGVIGTWVEGTIKIFWHLGRIIFYSLTGQFGKAKEALLDYLNVFPDSIKQIKEGFKELYPDLGKQFKEGVMNYPVTFDEWTDKEKARYKDNWMTKSWGWMKGKAFGTPGEANRQNGNINKQISITAPITIEVNGGSDKAGVIADEVFVTLDNRLGELFKQSDSMLSSGEK